MTSPATPSSPRTPIAQNDIVFCAVPDQAEADACWINSFVVTGLGTNANGVAMAYVGDGHGERAHPIADLRHYGEPPNEVTP